MGESNIFLQEVFKRKMDQCGRRCEIYSRVVGYFRPVANWNLGKKQEFSDRLAFSEEKSLKSEGDALKDLKH